MSLQDIIEEGPFVQCGKHVFGCHNCKCGSSFTDRNVAHHGGLPTQIRVSYGDDPYTTDINTIVQGIQITYGNKKGIYHGNHGNGLEEKVCNLTLGENITMVEGSAGLRIRDSQWLQQIKFHTTNGNICGPYGGHVGEQWSSSFKGCNLFYISGTILTQSISSITFHWKCEDFAIQSEITF